MANEILTRGCSLKYGTTPTTEITNMISFPDFGAAPDTVEVTNLSDTNKRYINGLQDFGSLEFEFNYESGPTGNYAKTKVLNGSQNWAFELPDGSKFTFSGESTAILGGGAPGEAMTWTLAITVNSAITYAAPTTLAAPISDK